MVVVDAVLVVVVVVATVSSGAHTSFDTFGVSVRVPNWSVQGMDDSAARGHLTL
jgi:hypothetical protein